MRLQVLNLETEEILCAHNDILIEVFSLNLPDLSDASHNNLRALSKVGVDSLHIASEHVNVGDRRADDLIDAI